jgi:hypothetical protein
MTISVFARVTETAIFRRSVPRSVFAALFLSAFICFLAQMNLRFEISTLRDLRSEIHAHVWDTQTNCQSAIDDRLDLSSNPSAAGTKVILNLKFQI